MNKIESNLGSEQMIDEPEIEEKVEIDISGEVSKDLGELFKIISRKFNNPEDGWTPARLEANSTEKLAPIIRELRSKLEAGGSADPDGILQDIIESAQKEEIKDEFVKKMTDPSLIVPGSNIAKFNIFIAKGLEK